MKKKRLSKWLTSILLTATTTLSCVGCSASDYAGFYNLMDNNTGGINNQSGYSSYDDIVEATKPKYYTFSAPVYNTDDFDTTNEEGDYNVDNTDYFDDVYLFVDPGADAYFVNDYKQETILGPEKDKFVDIVQVQLDAMVEDLLDRLKYVYGDKAHGNSTIDFFDGKIKFNAIDSITPSPTAPTQMDEQDNIMYDVLSLNDLSYLAELDGSHTHDPLNYMPLSFDDAISGKYVYQYQAGLDDTDPDNPEYYYEGEGFVNEPDTELEWEYSKTGKFTTDLIKLNIAEILSGIPLNRLSNSYSTDAYDTACNNIKHLGFLASDVIYIKQYLLEKVIGQEAIDYDTSALYSLIKIANADVTKDETNGNVTYNSDKSKMFISGMLAFDKNKWISDLNDTHYSDYETTFTKAHNYKAYQQIVPQIVDNVILEKFSAVSPILAEEDVFTRMPRLRFLIVPIDIIDGSKTTHYDNTDPENPVTSYDLVLESMNIVSFVLRPKGGIVRTEIVTADGAHQYEEGFNLTSIEAVFYSEEYGADIQVEVEGKADGVDIVNENNERYSFTETITPDTYPNGDFDPDTASVTAYPETYNTTLVDEEKAKTEWVGNHMLGFNGVDIEAILDSRGLIKEEVTDEDGMHLYYYYDLPVRLNEQLDEDEQKIIVISAKDRYVVNAGGDIIYLSGYQIDADFGDNYLKLDLSVSNVVDTQGQEVDDDFIEFTMLSIDPQMAIWVWGATDLIEEYANA